MGVPVANKTRDRIRGASLATICMKPNEDGTSHKEVMFGGRMYDRVEENVRFSSNGYVCYRIRLAGYPNNIIG